MNCHCPTSFRRWKNYRHSMSRCLTSLLPLDEPLLDEPPNCHSLSRYR
ncbi:MAG: hypothetical protein R3A10_17795 [Caldilineaceae bacterium]